MQMKGNYFKAGSLRPLKVPGSILLLLSGFQLEWAASCFLFKQVSEEVSYENALKSRVASPVFVVALAMGVSFVCLPAQRCACELTSDTV